MATWYPGSGVTWNKYLQDSSFVKDLTKAVHNSSEALRASISEQTAEIVGIRNITESGFGSLDSALSDINSSVENLRADFEYGLGLLLEEMQIHNKLFSSLLEKMDAIQKTLESPTLTQAREFYRIGCQRLSKGLLDKALEAFVKSLEKNDADFFTHFRIGKLYLYGIDEDDDVIDLSRAKSHLLLAARYAKAEITRDKAFAPLAAESYLHASIALYAQLNRVIISKETPSKVASLIEARQMVNNGIGIYPGLSELFYHDAKYSALLGEPGASMESLKTAIESDRGYAIKVDADKAFDQIRPHVFDLLENLRSRKRNEATEIIGAAARVIEEDSKWNPEESSHFKSLYDQRYEYLRAARETFQINTYFGFLDAIGQAKKIVQTSSEFRIKRAGELEAEIEELIISADRSLPDFPDYSRDVQSLRKMMEASIADAKVLINENKPDSFAAALLAAKAAVTKAIEGKRIADEINRKRDEKRKRSDQFESNMKAGGAFSFMGAILGAIIGLIVGFVQCNNNFNPYGHDLWLWCLKQLFFGTLYGLVIGIVLGFIVGFAKESNNNN